MKNLGKFLLFIIFSIDLFAKVTVAVDQNVITPGNVVNFNLSGEGFDAPDIKTLCGVNVLGRSSQTSINGMNGKFTKTKTITYSFAPEQSCTIEPIKITTDNGEITTKALRIIVKPLSAEARAKFSIQMYSDKKEVYVGEPFKITLNVKQRRDMKVVDSKFAPPDLSGFWVKKQQQEQPVVEGDYVVTKVIYIVAAQRDGNLSIANAKMSLAQREMNQDPFFANFMPALKWSRYISNSLHVKVKALPKGVDIAGSGLTLDMQLDKTKANANEPVNATIKLSGAVNFEDIGSLKPFIPNVSVFEDDAQIKHDIKNGEYVGEYTKKLAFVADNNFTIPAITVTYLNTKTHEIKVLQTKPVKVEIIGGGPQKNEAPLVVEKAPKEAVENVVSKQDKGVSDLYLLLAAVGGFVFGMAFMLLIPLVKGSKEKSITIASSDIKGILVALIEYKEDSDVKEMIELLEKKLYLDEDVKVDKNKLKALRKKYGF